MVGDGRRLVVTPPSIEISTPVQVDIFKVSKEVLVKIFLLITNLFQHLASIESAAGGRPPANSRFLIIWIV
jgi:hypothetical protein